MADSRKLYKVLIAGIPHDLLLSPNDAERYGDQAVEVKSEAKQPVKTAGTGKGK